jgi:Rrf2 family transcriptional regulator, nitric oxide-sensitive transcriptional repressor
MKLNLHTDFALRLLMYLAQAPDQPTVDKVASAFGISRHHLMKVAQTLVSLELVDARRGRGGGLSLARPAAEINLGAVVRALEPTGSFVECFDRKTNDCAIAGVCGLQGALNLALGDFLKRLDGYSLADLVPDPKRFRAALGLTNS